MANLQLNTAPAGLTGILVPGDGATLTALSESGDWPATTTLRVQPATGAEQAIAATVAGTLATWTLTVAQITALVGTLTTGSLTARIATGSGDLLRPVAAGRLSILSKWAGIRAAQSLGTVVVGPAGPTAVSADAGNAAELGTDGLLYVSPTAGSAHVIKDEGAALTARPTLNFAGAGVTVTDDAGNGATLVTIPGAAAGATTLDGLTDVATAGQSAGKALVSDGTNWAPSSAAVILEGDSRLTDQRPPSAHTHDDRYYTEAETAAAIQSALDGATIGGVFGVTQGVPLSPWRASQALGAEMWRVDNLYVNGGYPNLNTTALAMTKTANGSAQEIRTLVKLAEGGNLSNGDTTWRVEFDFAGTANGSWAISVGLRVAGDTTPGGQNRQGVVTSDSPTKTGRFMMDFTPKNVSQVQLEIRIKLENNATAGTVTVTNGTVKQVGAPSRPMYLTRANAPGVRVWTNTRDIPTNAWLLSGTQINGGIGSVVTYATDAPWQNPLADPTFVRSYASLGQIGQSEVATATAGPALSVGNRDQIFQAYSLDDTLKGADSGLYGNVHGGESTVSQTYAIDQGSGFVPVTLATSDFRYARRVQTQWNSSLTADTDPAPFALADHLLTFFPDGMMRCDRTTTFQRDTKLKDYFEWMSSYGADTPMVGRIGRGMTVLGEVDTFTKVAQPGAATVTTATTGGTLPAATYSYRVTALSSEGETTPGTAGTVTVSDVGGTSANTVTWSAVTSATGYRVYGRTAGVERLLATIPAGTLSWVDAGTSVPVGAPPGYNAARLTTASSDSETAADATWAVWNNAGWCAAEIYDRESALSRSSVGGALVRLVRAPGIQKVYQNLFWSVATSYTIIPAGTVWTATHWSMVYRPADPAAYHQEVAVRAASLAALKSLYPVT